MFQLDHSFQAKKNGLKEMDPETKMLFVYFGERKPKGDSFFQF